LRQSKVRSFFIVKQINAMTFQFKFLGSMRNHHVFHVSLLEFYHTSTISRRIHDPLHLLKSMVNMNMKWKTFKIQKSLVINSNVLFIRMGMMWTSTPGNQSRTYRMPWRRCMNFIDDIQTSPSLLLVELIIRKGGDVTNANIKYFFK